MNFAPGTEDGMQSPAGSSADDSPAGRSAVLHGQAWVFGDNVSTDHIAPGRLFHLRTDLPELAKHVMEDTDPAFASSMRPGDIIVGGRNFGLGSSREHAPCIIKLAGVGAVLAQSFARIFFRNAINVGLPALQCDTGAIKAGDELEVDLAAGEVRDLTSGSVIAFVPLPPVMVAILSDGGLVAHVQKHGGFALPGRGGGGRPASEAPRKTPRRDGGVDAAVTHRVTLIPGDGVGPELVEAARAVLAVSGVSLEFELREAGAAMIERHGTPLPIEVLDSIRSTGVALKGPVTTPVGGGFRSVNVTLRTELGLYASLRPARSLPGAPCLYPDVDLVIVRENTEDLYVGQERMVDDDTAESVKVITRSASERVARFAFAYAREHGRHSVTAVHKANIMKLSDGLFLKSVRAVAAELPGRPLPGPHRRRHVPAAHTAAAGLRRARAAEPVR